MGRKNIVYTRPMILTEEYIQECRTHLKRDYISNPIRMKEVIDIEDLKFLYLEKNLTKIEVAQIMGCKAQQVNHFCFKYRLLKTKEQTSEITSIKNTLNAQKETQEFKEQRKKKWYETWNKRTAEDNEKLRQIKSENSKKMWKTMSEERKQLMKTRMSISAKKQAEKETPEFKQQRIEKFQKTWYSAPPEVQEQRRQKCKETAYNQWVTMSKEKRENRSKKWRETMQNKSEEEQKAIQDKIYKTKKANNSLYSSKAEKQYEVLLKEKFGNNNVKTQYKSENYPFACDFYIKDRDLYIDLNFHWTHGKHPFNENNEEDIKRLNTLKERESRSEYYTAAIYVWTDLDVRKLNHCIEHSINRLVFYTEKELDKWLKEQ